MAARNLRALRGFKIFVFKKAGFIKVGGPVHFASHYRAPIIISGSKNSYDVDGVGYEETPGVRG